MQNTTYKSFYFFKLIFFTFLFSFTTQIRAQFPFIQSFKNSTAPGIEFGGSPKAFLTGGAGLRDGYNDIDGEGYLRLTNKSQQQRGIVWSDLYAFPSKYGMTISFEYYTHGGTGADGIAFILFDATASPVTAGAFGSSLGYAQQTGVDGFSKGYLGIGIDEYGGFASNDGGKTGGSSSGISSNITIRGQGSGTTGYSYLTGAQTTISPNSFNVAGRDRTATDDTKSGFRKIEIVLNPRSQGGFFIDVNLTHGNIKSSIITNYAYTTIAPQKLKFAISSSTGAETNFHEIRNLDISVDLPTLFEPIATPLSFSGCAGLPATSLNDINTNNNGSVNTLGSINRESIDLDLETPGIQASKTIEGKGTFSYDSVTGKITFKPTSNTVEGTITIDYTFKDNYGKPSNISNITYTAIVNRPADIVIPATICLGDSYLWSLNGQSYSNTGTYKIINDGCTANQELVLTVTSKPAKITTSTEICLGDSFLWDVNNTSYNAAGTYIKNNNGCTADQELILTVTSKPAKVTTTKEICSGESFLWDVNNTSYNAAGTYIKNNNGCTADQELILTITPKPAKITITKEICSGESFLWDVNNTSYNTAGTYVKTNNGCTADQELVLTVTSKPAKVTTTKEICSGESFLWDVNNTSYNTAGNYIKDNNGCTADQELILTITSKPAKVTTTKEICSGESFLWDANNTSYNAAGTYVKTNNSCTADQELILTITPKPAKITTKKEICSGESFLWDVNNTSYNAAGTYIKTNNGCTADQELILTITPKPAKITITKEICSGESFLWDVNNTSYNTAGTYIKNNNGCTADQELILTITPKPAKITITKEICSGESFLWDVNNTSYNAAGTYVKTNNGCTADQELVLTLTSKPAKVTTTKEICSGESFLWDVNNTSYNAAGTYIKNNNGCTADQELVLTITSKPAKVITTKEICSGDSFLWDVNNTSYNTTGTYIKNNSGCTADQELILTITPKPAKVTTIKEICSGESFLWDANNTSYTTAGTYIKNNNGCTADQELVLTVTSKPTKVTTTKEICSGESFLWDVNNTSYTTAGTYIKNNNGCTADQELVLTITSKPAKVTTTKEICSGDSFLWDVNNTSYNAAGTYIKNNNGCTADQELNLIVLATPAKPTFSTITQPTCRNANGNFSIINYDPSYIYTVIPNTNVVQTGNIIMAPIGQYTVEVNNGNCQSVSEIVFINSPLALAATLSTNSLLPELCSGDKDGSFKIEISGGTMPYSVNLDTTNGPYLPITGNEHMFINLSGGIHTVYVKDASGCTTELKVMMPKAISINPVVNINYDCVNNFPSNSVTISIDKTITDYSDIDYALDGGFYQPDNIFTNIAAGTHTITARHSNGCTQLTTPFTIKDIQPLTLSLTDGDLNEIITTAAGGGSEYQYSIDGESYSKNNKFIIYKSGDYTVTITDKNGCTAATTRYFEYIDVCIPNYFTPNGDGINDEWGPGCTENYKSLTFTIFDRYGRIIGNFKYGQKWDGKYNGAELTSGDYWYTLKLNHPKDEREFVGHFTLYR